DRPGDIQEVLPELTGYVFVARVFARQFHRDRQKIQAVHGHPPGTVGLLDEAPGGQRLAAVEDAYVVQPQKSALEDIAAFGILAIHPPREVEQQLVEDALQKCTIPHAAPLLLD